MGMHNEAPNAPDTFGLPEFFVTDVHTEIAGSNVRMICGVKRGGIVHWLYSVVMPAEEVLATSRDCAAAAAEAYNIIQMMDRRKGH